MTNTTIVVATHIDGNTSVQENGPAALLTLARYLASLPITSRQNTIKFAFAASHLVYQRDSDKAIAKSIDATYENNTVAFVIAIEHLGTRELAPSPAPNGTCSPIIPTDGRAWNILQYCLDPNHLQWSLWVPSLGAEALDMRG